MSQPDSAQSNDERSTTRNQISSAHLTDFTREYCTISEKFEEEMLTIKRLRRLKLICCKFASKSIAETIVTIIDHELETLVLSGSAISEEHLLYIGENMSRNNKLKNLDLSHIPLNETGVKAASKIKSKARHLEWLNLHDCELNGKLLETLSSAAGPAPVKTLTLSSNPDISDNVKIIADLIDKFGCNDIDISANSLGSTQIIELASTPIQGEVNTIHVCENPIGDWEALGDLVRNWTVKNVDASECRMRPEDCEDFASALYDYELDDLNVCNPDRTKKYEEKTRKLLEGTARNVIVNEADLK